MANKGGGWVFGAVLIGAIALAGGGSSGTTSSTSTSASSSQSDGFNLDFFGDNTGGVCNHTTTFTSSQGSYTIPSNNSHDPVTARDCFMDSAPGHGPHGPVQALQRSLVQCYQQPIAVDGIYGASTTNSVKVLQGKLHITVDGRYGPQTAGAMAWPTKADDGKTTCVAHPG